MAEPSEGTATTNCFSSHGSHPLKNVPVYKCSLKMKRNRGHWTKVINIIILVLYRVGYDGRFLGVGGTWNLNEEKNPDVEIIASGVFVGYIIYTLAVLVSYCFGTTEQKRTLVDIIMNFSGCILWIAVGGTALHYWHGYQSEHKFLTFTQEREVGLALGSLCVIQGAVYLLDTVSNTLLAQVTPSLLSLQSPYFVGDDNNSSSACP
uniref:Protein snakeskin n=1 Tax=Timema poppense TaxID=170557 RepID=A0A7R9CYI6_TIMPO|nr:unnamed protein product [Timema poppensis]